MRNQLSKFFVALAVVCVVCAMQADAGAQRRRQPPRARGYTKAEVGIIIRRVENRSDDFIKLFDKALDRSGLDGTRREDNLNERARSLEKSLDDLRREFDRKESYLATRPEVSRTLNIANEIDKVMKRRRMGGETERQWALLRIELNTLADVYNLKMLR
ncbi:MAG: hypothetical protein LC802_10770 [Acidobacteria bacterium]|nr:hypothetical protein [Acidobacteriota bacterium]